MANELICSVCEQRIEPNPARHDKYPNSTEFTHVKNLLTKFNAECWGKAVPKAPEPTGDDKTCRNCGEQIEPSEAHKKIGNGVFIHTETGSSYCEVVQTQAEPKAPTGDESYHTSNPVYAKFRREPKAPDVIEMELPPLDVTDADRKEALLELENIATSGSNLRGFVNILKTRERQLKAEIAAKQKAEKERDAALADVKLLRMNHPFGALYDALNKAQLANTQLQRDLDAAKELLREYRCGCSCNGDARCIVCCKNTY